MSFAKYGVLASVAYKESDWTSAGLHIFYFFWLLITISFELFTEFFVVVMLGLQRLAAFPPAVTIAGLHNQ